MLRRYIFIINFFLIILSLFLVDRIYEIWKPKEYPKEPTPLMRENKATFPSPSLTETKKVLRHAYKVIVDKDVFRPERTEWKPDVQTEEAKAVTVTAPQLKVFGIVISAGFKHAWIQEEGKAEKVKRVSDGDEIGGWKVNKIEPNVLSVTNGKQIVTFNLIEPGKPKPRTIPKSLVPPPKPTPTPQQPRRVPPQPQRPLPPPKQ